MVGSPGHLENALKQIQRYVIAWLIVSGVLLIGGGLAASYYLDLEPILLFGLLLVVWVAISLIVGSWVSYAVSKPLKALSQAILHISPSPIPIKSPDIEKLSLGRELITNLIRQVYELNSGSQQVSAFASDVNMSLQQLPVAVISIDKNADIKFANVKAKEIAASEAEITGKNLYGLFDIFFPNDDTLQKWIETVRAKSVTAQKIWRGVRINKYQGKTQYIDLAASYSKQTGAGSEVILTLFDETEVYSEQDSSFDFIALAVHELRTPLTILRGYIEVFEEELDTKSKPQMNLFMQKMQASAENLTAFVGNILDVARVDQDQLTLHLNKENWSEVLGNIIDDMKLRAEVRGKTIDLTIASDLPEAGIDRVSISEVVMNLIDNAIKYSPPDKKAIKINCSLNKEGLIETTIQDFGVGIPENVMPHLFEKFSRNYRNRASIGGTGLGLYLSKALVSAHGGNIWVRSREGEGSTFGFTVLPYERVAQAQRSSNNEIMINAHGWIKNHSLSRR